MKVSFNFATVASLMVVPPLSTSVPKLGFVQVVEGGTIEPRSIIQDRDLSTWNIYRMKGSKKNTAAPTPVPVASPSLAPVGPVPVPKGPTKSCDRCKEKQDATEETECWYEELEKLMGFTPNATLEKITPLFQLSSFQKPAPTELRAIGGDQDSWGGMTTAISHDIKYVVRSNETEFKHSWERAYAQIHQNEALPSKVVYKQSLKDPNTDAYNIPYDINFNKTNEQLLNIVLNIINPSVPQHMYFYNFTVTMEQAMKELVSTDGIMVIKDGAIIAEHYVEPFNRRSRHRAYSMTKSYTGLMLAMLIDEGRAKYGDLVTKHVPQLNEPKYGAFKDTTIRHVMDMSIDFQYEEGIAGIDCLTKIAEEFHCADDPSKIPTGEKYDIIPGCESAHAIFYVERPDAIPRELFLAATRGLYARPPGPQSFKDGLLALKRDNTKHKNGKKFTYRSSNSDVLGWMIETFLENEGIEWLSDNLWSKVKQNSDMLMLLDQRGFPEYHGGLSLTLKDSARFSEMMRNNGTNYKGDVVVPKHIVMDILNGGTATNLNQFKTGKYGDFLNCVFTVSKQACNTTVWDVTGSLLPENYPVAKYLKAIGDPNYREGIVSGMAYRNQHWVLPHHMVSQQGVHGQYSVFFPKVNMTIAIFSSQVKHDDGAWLNYLMMFAIADYFAHHEVKVNPTP